MNMNTFDTLLFCTIKLMISTCQCKKNKLPKHCPIKNNRVIFPSWVAVSVSVLKRLSGPFGMSHPSAEHFTHRVLTFLYTICERLHNSEAEINKCTVGLMLYVWGHWTSNKVPFIFNDITQNIVLLGQNTGIALRVSNEWQFYVYKCPKEKHPHVLTFSRLLSSCCFCFSEVSLNH